MATTLAKKLLIKEGFRVLVINGFEDFDKTLGDLPEGAVLEASAKGEFDIVIAFFTEMSGLDDAVEDIKKASGQKGIIWICYPKGTSKVETDLNRDILRQHLLQVFYLEGVALIAIDNTWSAMRVKKV